MRLYDFRALIANMPTAYHSSTAKRSDWKDLLTVQSPAGAALRSIFGTFDEVSVSRSDLRFSLAKGSLDRFVMATLLWGYPDKIPLGKNITQFAKHPTYLGELTDILTKARVPPGVDWDTHFFKDVQPKIKYVAGVSTYTKFLNFLSVNVCGYPALILDKRIVRVAERGIFAELGSLRQLIGHLRRPTRGQRGKARPSRPENTDGKIQAAIYTQYLSLVHKIAEELSVPAENIEFFLFEFGSGVNDIEQNIRLRAYELYEHRGRVHGLDLQDWFNAEREIRSGSLK
jgi:hypothetical protein